MEEKLIAAKAAMSVACSAMAAFLGWKGVLVLVWICLMVLDYISGTIAACKQGEWSSRRAGEGIIHKVGMLVVGVVAMLADLAVGMACSYLPLGFQWPVVIYPLVCVWYILTEIGSVLENAAKMGAPVPKWLLSLLEVSFRAVDTVGSSTVEKK